MKSKSTKQPRRKRQSPLDEQKSIAFSYHEQLAEIIKDLEILDKLIPRESSRYGSGVSVKIYGSNAPYIIAGRKNDLLSYIQTICRDHICFSKPLLESGWTIEQHRNWKRAHKGKAERIESEARRVASQDRREDDRSRDASGVSRRSIARSWIYGPHDAGAVRSAVPC